MPGKMSFNVTVYNINTEIIPQLANRVKNLSGVFHEIINEWAIQNNQKFNRGAGQEGSGVNQDADVFWEHLTPSYMKQKAAQGFTNSLMVRTGALRAALTNPAGFYRAVNPEQAIFGRPNDINDEIKLLNNWKTRQVLFLADYDQQMIRKKISDYIQGATIPRESLKESVAKMDIEFKDKVG